MKKLQVLCVDDQAEVGAAVSKDLQELNSHIELINCDSAADAEAVLKQLDAMGSAIALIICDQVMPEKQGVDFLSEVKNNPIYEDVQSILLTGQASHEDTIRAINDVHINAYIGKPWEKENLINTVKRALARYVLRSGMDYMEYMPVIDQTLLYRELH